MASALPPPPVAGKGLEMNGDTSYFRHLHSLSRTSVLDSRPWLENFDQSGVGERAPEESGDVRGGGSLHGSRPIGAGSIGGAGGGEEEACDTPIRLVTFMSSTHPHDWA
jgi:hypothetical protein